MTTEMLQYFSQFVTEQRYKTLQRVLANRTRYITIALEDIFQTQNASAVLRSSECFGIQDVHVIENKNVFKVHPGIEMGASKWLDIHRYYQNAHNTLDAIKLLKSQGYRIVATTPHTNDVNLEEFDLTKGKIGLFFGTEKEGLSDVVLENADEFLKIPMVGFTESLNISVSAATTLHHLLWKLRNSDINWQLPENEYNEMLYLWLKYTIKSADLIEKEYLKKIEN